MSDANSVIVVGAGIVGTATALNLQRRGRPVTLVDRAEPGEGTSYGSGAILVPSSIIPVTTPGLIGKLPSMLSDPLGPVYMRWSYLPRMLPWLMRYLAQTKPERVRHVARHMAPMVADSLDEHRALAAGTAAERYIHSLPYAFVFKSRAAFEADPFAWDLRRENGISWRTLEGDAVAEAEPALSQDYRFLAIFDDQHGLIDAPGDYIKALAGALAAGGGEIVSAEVKGFLRDGNRITGIETDRGRHEAETTVIAAGAWSARLLTTLGLDIPMETERGYHLDLLDPSMKPNMAMMIADGKFVCSPMPSRLRIAGLVEFGGLDAGPSAAPVNTLKTRLARVFPSLTYGEMKPWLGHRPAPVDSLPILGPIRGLDGLVCAFGHHHVGLTSGPRTARLIADMVAGRQPNIDLSPYSPGRFTKRD
ncbi:MAG: FAD-binding oxidoreductase [Rhodospirillaceae bacterium]